MYTAAQARRLGSRILGALEAYAHVATPKVLARLSAAAYRAAIYHVYCQPGKGIVGSCDPASDPQIDRALGLSTACRWCRRTI